MSAKLENLRIVRGYDLGGIDQNADVVLFDHNGSESLEYLDGNELGADHDSNLRNHLDHDEADEIRERLAAWLAGPSHKVRWVAALTNAEMTGWEVAHGGDIEAVKGECLRELLDQCGTAKDRDVILAGTVEATPVAA